MIWTMVLTAIPMAVQLLANAPVMAQAINQSSSNRSSSNAPEPIDAQIIDADATVAPLASGGFVDSSGFFSQVPLQDTQPQTILGACQPCIRGIDCLNGCGDQIWKDARPLNFQPLAHGEYLGPIRLTDTINYRVRIGDRIQFIFARNRETPVDTYTLLVGDELQISSLSMPELKVGDLVQGRGIAIQPDGYLYLNGVGKVRAAGLTLAQLRKNLESAYRRLYGAPGIDVLPIKTNTQQDDILDSIDARQGIAGGRSISETVHPDGTVRLIPIGAVYIQGLTVDEVKREVNLRYKELVPGLHIEPIIEQEAPHYVFVYGEVGQPDRYQLLGPTSVTQALAMARGINPRGNAREIVIFRRAEDWRMLATRLDLQGMHLGKVPTPADEIWLRDSDLIIVPKTPIARFNDFVDQVFRQGAYGIFPYAQLGTGFNPIGFPGGF
jgi:polysaccharide biosynthesis/export protein